MDDAPPVPRRPAVRGPLSDEEIREEFREVHADQQITLNTVHRMAQSVDTLHARLAEIPSRAEFAAVADATPRETQVELMRLQREVLRLQAVGARLSLWGGMLRGAAVPIAAYAALHWQGASHWIAHLMAPQTQPGGGGGGG